MLLRIRTRIWSLDSLICRCHFLLLHGTATQKRHKREILILILVLGENVCRIRYIPLDRLPTCQQLLRPRNGMLTFTKPSLFLYDSPPLHLSGQAYQICQERDLVLEMVFLLGRMGNNKKALTLIIERLGDVHRAIEFAKEQSDDDLWEDLLKYSETRPGRLDILIFFSSIHSPFFLFQLSFVASLKTSASKSPPSVSSGELKMD